MEENNKLVLLRKECNSENKLVLQRRREMMRRLNAQRMSEPGGSGLLGNSDTVSPTRLMGIRLQQAVLGTTIPIIIGQQRVAWKIGWYGDFLSWPENGGSGLIKGGGNYAYSASILGIVCLGPTVNFLGIWASGFGKSMVSSAPVETYAIPSSPEYIYYVPNLADIYIQDTGVGIASNYSIDVNDYGSQAPVTQTGTQQVPLQYTSSSTPGPGYYSTTTGPFTAWSSVTSYTIGELVTYSGVNYVCIANNTNEQPPNVTYWATAPIVYIFNSADSLVGNGVATVNYQVFYANFLQTQLGVVPNIPGPYVITVDFANQWPANSGSQGWQVSVAYYPSGNPFTIVSSTPTAVGEVFPNYGNFTFYSGDAGEAVVIEYTYTDNSLYQSAGNHGVPNRVNYTFFTGELGQEAWEFTYVNPPGEVPSQTFTNQTPPIAYSEVAYVGSAGLYLGYTPQVPQLNFEILGSYPFSNGIGDANPADAIYGCLTNPTYKLYFPGEYIDSSLLTGNSSVKNFWSANNFFISAVLDSQSSLMSIIGDWCEAGQAWISWDEGRMKFIPLGDTSAVANGVQYTPPTGNAANVELPVIDLDDNDFVVEKNQDPITIEQSPWQNRWNRVNIRWNVRINDYNEDCLQVSDEAGIQQYGLMQEAAKSYPFLCTQNAALFAATMRLQRFQSIFTTYKFVLKSNFAFLSPGDIITVTDGLLGSQGTMFGRTPVRIIKMSDDPKKGIAIEAETFPWSVGTAILYNVQAQIPSNINQGPNADPGSTTAIIFEIPNQAAQYNGDQLYIFCNGENTNWGGFQMWVSYDGITYNPYGTYQNQGRIGTTIGDFPYHTDPDYTDTLTVNMIEGGAQLQSVSESAWNAYVSLSAVVSQNVSNSYTQVASSAISIASGGGGGTSTQGPLEVTSGISQDPGTGAFFQPWSNASAITQNVAYANCSMTYNSMLLNASQWLNGFVQFDIPIQGIGDIIGIQITCTAYCSSDSPTPSVYAFLNLGGSSPISNQINLTAGPFPITPTTFTIGSLSSLSVWGGGLSEQNLVEYLNSGNFGVSFQAYLGSSGTSTFFVNDVTIEVAWSGSGYGNTWNNPSYVSYTNSSYTTSTFISSESTGLLFAYNFNFNIPFGFVFTGLSLSCKAFTNTAPGGLFVGLVSNSIQVGVSKDVDITTNATTYTFGSTTDDWGTQEGFWTYSLLDAQGQSGFGVILQAQGDVNDTVSINSLTVTIYGEGDYALELIAYETATLVDPYTYALTTIHRGILGSIPCDHPNGSTFARMDEATINYTVPAQYLGSTIYFKFLSFNSYGNQLQSLANVSPVAVYIQGLSPGAISNDTGALLTGTPNYAINEMELAFGTLKGSFGLQNIPSGYALIGPQGQVSGTPTWQNVQEGSGGGVNDMYIYIPPIAGQYGISQELYFSIPVRNITIGSGMVGSTGGCRIAPTGNVSVGLYQNGSSIGSVNIAANTTSATFTFTNSVSWNGFSDTFQILAPATPDKTFAGFFLDIYASRAN